MNYLKQALSFHLLVFKKITKNIYFFTLAYFLYMASDILIYQQSLTGDKNAFADKSQMMDVSVNSMTNWLMYFFVFFAYIVTPCLLSLYYSRNHNSNASLLDKVKIYLRPIINFRLYLVYALFFFCIFFSISVSLRFIPDVVNGFVPAVMEYFKLQAHTPELVDNSPVINGYILTILNVKWYSWFLFLLSNVLILFITFSMYIFSLPLVIKSKNNTLIYSLKSSLKGVFSHFVVFILTIMVFELIRFIIFIITFDIDYLGRIVSILFSTVFLFYIIVGLEKFVLEKIKK